MLKILEKGYLEKLMDFNCVGVRRDLPQISQKGLEERLFVEKGLFRNSILHLR